MLLCWPDEDLEWGRVEVDTERKRDGLFLDWEREGRVDDWKGSESSIGIVKILACAGGWVCEWR